MAGNGKVFVSHTHADNERCEPLLAALDAWRVDYWFDAQQLDAGQQLSPRLQQAITERDILLRVCTANTAQSYWMNLEQSAFSATQYQQRRNRRGSSPRLSIDLVLDAAYQPGTAESANVVISALNKPQRAVLVELAAALGVKQREQPQGAISRRALLGLSAGGVVTAASLVGAGLLVKSRDNAAAAPYHTPKTVAFTNPQTLDKRIQWYTKLGDSLGAALALAGSQLIVSCLDGLFALDAATGDVQWWRPDVNGNATCGLAIDGDTIYAAVTGLSGELFAVKLSDGSSIWKAGDLSTLSDTGFVLANGVIYMIADDGAPVAFSANGGGQLWKSGVKTSDTSSAFRAPTVDATGLYVGSDDGTFHAFSLVDGSQLWSYQTGGAIGYAAAVANGVVYFGSQDQYLYALNTADGSLRWRYGASIEVDYTPAIVGSTLYVGLFDHIAAFDASTGALLWQVALDASQDNSLTGSLIVAGEVAYVPANDSLYAFSLQTRNPLWSFATGLGEQNTNSPLVAGATVYWSGANRAVYALSAAASA